VQFSINLRLVPLNPFHSLAPGQKVARRRGKTTLFGACGQMMLSQNISMKLTDFPIMARSINNHGRVENG
jgi:hypothetical protein